MKISPLYQVLVYLEHNGHSDTNEIKKWGDAVSRGILGKMEAMQLIDKTVKNNTTFFKLSDKGYGFLNSILDVLHHSVEHWDNKWRVVWFSVPEKERPKRDKFRRALEGFGFRPILGSAWISPLDLKKEVLDVASKLKMENYYILAETENLYGIDLPSIISAWNFEKYRSYFEEFITKSTQVLADIKTNKPIDYKILIFEYALILNSEPRLPIELMPKDWPKFRASLIYKKLRRLIS